MDSEPDDVLRLVDELLMQERSSTDISNHREDRQRRSRAAAASSPMRTIGAGGCAFAVGNRVVHDTLGEGVVRRLREVPASDTAQTLPGTANNILFQWEKIVGGRGRKRRMETLNRWVGANSLTKIRASPRSEHHTSQDQHQSIRISD
ncbi:hypothetical protein AB1Y20_001395 [Prymnesium parvum]|uniref:Uncharacterized protein n=1 Tax=Prymnesium parvum TaxID=97485 RepID=A0AB34K9H2_PRYPA